MDLYKLIDLVRNSPEIYYTRTYNHVKGKLWANIAKEMNEDDKECRLKWKNLRSQFLREEKKLIDNHCHITWQYHKHMIFLREYLHSETFLVHKKKKIKPIHRILIKNEIDFEAAGEICDEEDGLSSSSELPTQSCAQKKEISQELNIENSPEQKVSLAPSPSPPLPTQRSSTPTPSSTSSSILSKLPSSLIVKQSSDIPSLQLNNKNEGSNLQTKSPNPRQNLQKLIRLVESEPILYNPMKFGSELQLYLVWQDIAKCMNCTPPISGLECQRKWTGLLNVYKRNIEQRQNMKDHSDHDHDQQHSKWLFDDEMSFMDKFLSMEKQQFDSSIIMFFKSILLDFKRLTSPRQRKFKVDILSVLNQLVDEHEDSSSVTRNDKAADCHSTEMCPDLMFFMSLLPNYEKIPFVQQRKFKEIAMKIMHKHFDEQEIELGSS